MPPAPPSPVPEDGELDDLDDAVFPMSGALAGAEAVGPHRLVGSPGRLDSVLSAALPLTRSRLAALIKAGAVRVDGAVVCRPSATLRGGEDLAVEVPPPPPSALVPEDLGLPLLHLDAQVVVVHKPAALVVHPAKGHPTGTLVHGLLHLCAAAVPTPGDFPVDPSRPGVVHRLDRGTSGVMVAARTPEALAALGAQFAAHTVERRYLALVHGRCPEDRGRVDLPLGRHPHDRLRIAVRAEGKRAVTHWERLAEGHFAVPGDKAGGVVSLVRCRLETGRTHQIRVHLTELGLPLVGDPLYGRPARPLPRALAEGIDHQQLHAARLGFSHPVSGARLRFFSPPEPPFLALCAALGIDPACWADT